MSSLCEFSSCPDSFSVFIVGVDQKYSAIETKVLLCNKGVENFRWQTAHRVTRLLFFRMFVQDFMVFLYKNCPYVNVDVIKLGRSCGLILPLLVV